jgi:hypothetical protein
LDPLFISLIYFRFSPVNPISNFSLHSLLTLAPPPSVWLSFLDTLHFLHAHQFQGFLRDLPQILNFICSNGFDFRDYQIGGNHFDRS